MNINRERNRKESHLEKCERTKRGDDESKRVGLCCFCWRWRGWPGATFTCFSLSLSLFLPKAKRKNMKHHAQRIFFSILYWRVVCGFEFPNSCQLGPATSPENSASDGRTHFSSTTKKENAYIHLFVFSFFVFRDNIRIIPAEILIRFLFVCVTNRPECVALQSVRSTLTRWPNLNQSKFSSIMSLIANELLLFVY